MKKVIILGGGVSGLTAAYLLHRYAHVTLIEKSSRLGGCIRSTQEGPFLFEQGPRGFRPTGTGRETLRLMQELGLPLLEANPASKTRYLAHRGSLRPLTPWFLLSQGLLKGLLRECFCKPSPHEDETLETFFTRHLGASLTHLLINPLARGIFGGNYKTLSARSCLPALWDKDKRQGSFLRPFSFKRPSPALITCLGGMEQLISALAKPLTDIRLNTTPLAIGDHCVQLPEGWVHADAILSALPASALYPLYANFSDSLGTNLLSENTLSLVHCGWQRPLLKKRGYGFLVPLEEHAPLMGMTWDSEIFPEQGPGTRLCLLMQGDVPNPQHLTQTFLSTFCDLDTPPDVLLSHTARLPQYNLGHHHFVSNVERALPPGFHLLGNSFYGLSINDCIAQAMRVAQVINSQNHRE